MTENTKNIENTNNTKNTNILSTDILITNKSYKLNPLPPDTSLNIIIELINGMELSLHPLDSGRPNIVKFIEDHPELVERIE